MKWTRFECLYTTSISVKTIAKTLIRRTAIRRRLRMVARLVDCFARVPCWGLWMILRLQFEPAQLSVAVSHTHRFVLSMQATTTLVTVFLRVNF